MLHRTIQGRRLRLSGHKDTATLGHGRSCAVRRDRRPKKSRSAGKRPSLGCQGEVRHWEERFKEALIGSRMYKWTFNRRHATLVECCTSFHESPLRLGGTHLSPVLCEHHQMHPIASASLPRPRASKFATRVCLQAELWLKDLPSGSTASG